MNDYKIKIIYPVDTDNPNDSGLRKTYINVEAETDEEALEDAEFIFAGVIESIEIVSKKESE